LCLLFICFILQNRISFTEGEFHPSKTDFTVFSRRRENTHILSSIVFFIEGGRAIMNKIVVHGGNKLYGEVEIGGSKNAALPVLFAGILTGDVCVFSALPRVSDVLLTLEILRSMGARIRFIEGGDVLVDYAPVRPVLPSVALTGAIRGSVYLLGAMLGRFGKAKLGGAGGCDFGARPIDQHLMGFEAMGATEHTENGALCLSATGGLHGADITLKMPSVGATANLLMAGAAASGKTVIRNAAAEPHVVALCEFLTLSGATVKGQGTDTLTVLGGTPLHGCKCTVIPDMIEAGTYLCAAMAAGGRVTVKNVVPEHLGAALDTLRDMGATLTVGKNRITLKAPRRYCGVDVTTGPYPAFPTDLHPQFAALFTLGHRATGKGRVFERVWQERFRYTEELSKLGACVKIKGECAAFSPSVLHPATLRSPDLRGGVSLVIAALSIAGRTEITNAATVGRGYEHFESKLRNIGADVRIFG